MEDFLPATTSMHALPVPWAEPRDISRSVVSLTSDDSRLITGQTPAIDAGLMVK